MTGRTILRTVTALLVVVLVAAVWVVQSRYEYKQWPWSKYPDPLTWCGRQWEPGGVQTRASIERTFHDFHRAGDLPGILNRGAVWINRSPGAHLRCQIGVWVQISSTRFEDMELEGSL